MQITRKSLFESPTLQIGLFEARAESDVCSGVERQDCNLVVLPLAGAFSKHDAPLKCRRNVTNSSTARLFPAKPSP